MRGCRTGRGGAGLVLALVLLACGGRDIPPGEAAIAPRSAAALRAAEARQSSVAPGARTILFGDLHVHTTYSIDAYVFALPMFGGEGVGPPADACDFARHCAALDFFSINDHAEALTPERWQATQDSIRACNDRAGDPRDPDLVAYVGYEWTQAGPTPESHYGHKNVIFRGLAPEEIPDRPITSLPQGTIDRARGAGALGVLTSLPRLGDGTYADFLWWMWRMAKQPDCEQGVSSPDLPPECRENAETPDRLFEKLAQWDVETLVIPHGLAWGIHAPPGSTIANQLTRTGHDPARQRLIEVYSGHGNSEEFRDLPEHVLDPAGAPVCPEPGPGYLPCCWRAGEIIRERCGDLPEEVCEENVREARRLALLAGTSPHLVIPDTRSEDWLDCDQCRDCFKPAMNLRPRESAQYALSLRAADDETDGEPLRFRFGFIGSSDNHSARPGTGYKQVDREFMTDARGFASETWADLLRGYVRGSQEDPRRAQAPPAEERGFRGLLDVERGASFMYPGGLVAVHSRDRSREAIWDALERREVYGTSGPRILLWFDLLNGPGGRAPMGSSVTLDGAPRFEVRAVGSFEPAPGCPEDTRAALGAERMGQLCGGECYRPSETRRLVRAIEVVRIRPPASPDEPPEAGIEDPWRVLPCPPDPGGCAVAFEDPDHGRDGRDSIYYVRALEEDSPAINGAQLRTTFGPDGRALRTDPCHGGFQTPADDDCLAPVQERAWSSPIFVDAAR